MFEDRQFIALWPAGGQRRGVDLHFPLTLLPQDRTTRTSRTAKAPSYEHYGPDSAAVRRAAG